MARPLQSILTRTEAEQTIIQSNVARSFVGQRIAQHYMDAMGESEVGCSRYFGNLWPDWSEPNRLWCHMQEIKNKCPSIRKRFANWLPSESVPSVHSTSRVERKYEGFVRQETMYWPLLLYLDQRRKSQIMTITLAKTNNLFVDVESVQRTMVRLKFTT